MQEIEGVSGVQADIFFLLVKRRLPNAFLMADSTGNRTAINYMNAWEARENLVLYPSVIKGESR